MQFLYHGVPENMVGTKLFPLNQMAGDLSQVKAQHLTKYQGREDILVRRIPLLDCLWNDVVQLLPLHPQKVFDLQLQLGLIPKIPAYRFYKIPLDKLDPNKTVVFFKSARGRKTLR